MQVRNEILENLIDRLASLPGIGKRSARRLAFYLITSERKRTDDLVLALREAKDRLKLCGKCYNLTENDLCAVCSDGKRDGGVICVVESFSDLHLLESLNVHRGTYHVLGGLISPLDGIGPSSIRLEELFARIKRENAAEVIISLNNSVEGETTALYIIEKLKKMNIRITGLATGIPVGGEIFHTDTTTLRKAYNERKILGE